jgi:hypothetical protein
MGGWVVRLVPRPLLNAKAKVTHTHRSIHLSPITNSTSNAWNAGIASNAGRRDISQDIRDVLTRIRALSSVDSSEALATYPDETYKHTLLHGLLVLPMVLMRGRLYRKCP